MSARTLIKRAQAAKRDALAYADQLKAGRGDEATFLRMADEARELVKRAEAAVAWERERKSFEDAAERALPGITGGAIAAAHGGTKMDTSLGTLLVESPQFEHARKSGVSHGWGTGAVEVPVAAAVGAKTTLAFGGGSVTGVDTAASRLRELPLPPPSLIDAIPSGATSGNAVKVVRQSALTNAADTVAEGAAKPEAALALDEVDEPVRKVAHWVPASTEILDDVPGLQALVDSQLRQGLLLTVEDQLLNGDGDAPNLLGILQRTGLAAAVPRGTDTNADAIYAQFDAITSATGIEPDTVVVNPANWRTVVLSKDKQDQYLYAGGPAAQPDQRRLWGARVVVTSQIAAGTALVFASRALQLFWRTQASVSMSNSHSDFYVRNLVAILAECRLALAMFVPQAVGTVTGLE